MADRDACALPRRSRYAGRSRQDGSPSHIDRRHYVACLEGALIFCRAEATAGPAQASPVRLPELGTRVSRVAGTECFAVRALP